MEIKDIKPDHAIYILIEANNEASFIEKSEVDKWVRDGSIEPGMHVLQVTVHNVFKAQYTVELVSTTVS